MWPELSPSMQEIYVSGWQACDGLTHEDLSQERDSVNRKNERERLFQGTKIRVCLAFCVLHHKTMQATAGHWRQGKHGPTANPRPRIAMGVPHVCFPDIWLTGGLPWCFLSPSNLINPSKAQTPSWPSFGSHFRSGTLTQFFSTLFLKLATVLSLARFPPAWAAIQKFIHHRWSFMRCAPLQWCFLSSITFPVKTFTLMQFFFFARVSGFLGYLPGASVQYGFSLAFWTVYWEEPEL